MKDQETILYKQENEILDDDLDNDLISSRNKNILSFKKISKDHLTFNSFFNTEDEDGDHGMDMFNVESHSHHRNNNIQVISTNSSTHSNHIKRKKSEQVETHLPLWLHQLYFSHKNSSICCLITCFIFFICVLSSSCVTYVISYSHSKIDSRQNARYMLQLFNLSLSVSGSFLVILFSFLSPSFGQFMYPGVFQLCFSHFIVDFLRLIQLSSNFSYEYRSFISYCKYIHVVTHFFQPATLLFICAIALNLLLALHGEDTLVTCFNFEFSRKSLVKWMNGFIWFYSSINTLILNIPYFKPKSKYSFFSNSLHSKSGICLGMYGHFYSFIILPAIVCIISTIITILFRKRIKYLYPKRATEMIHLRTNQFFIVYIITWAIVTICFSLTRFLRKVASNDTKYLLSTTGFFFYDIQGFCYAFVIIRTFLTHDTNMGTGLHLRNIDIGDIDFGLSSTILGEGAFAIVFQGKWRDTTVAVKVFKLSQVHKEEMKMEAYLASKLHHPYLVRTYGCGLVDNNSIAIVTELIDGGTLHDIIITKSSNYYQVLIFAQMIAKGMNFLHTQSPPVVHRDLKPSNCLVDRYTNTIKISDFGCSRWILVEDSGNNTLIKTPENMKRNSIFRRSTVDYTRTMTSNVGTPCWTAPELITLSNRTQYSLKVDVYSFGVMLWQLYTGEMPYEEVQGSLVALEEKVIEGYRPLIPKECPLLLKNMIEYCWDGNPKKRPSFQDICELIESELVILNTFEQITRDSCQDDIDTAVTIDR